VEEFGEAPGIIATAGEPAPVAGVHAPADVGAASPAASAATSLLSRHRRTWLLGGLLGAVALLAWAGWREQAALVEVPLPAANTAKADPVSLAVLPFHPLGGEVLDEGLALGLAETLITRLSRSPALQVRPLSSAQRVPAGAAAKDVGRQLGVAYVVDGTTQRSGDRIRVNARLMSVAGGAVLWGETFDASADKVFTLQDKIGDAVTSALALAPLPPGRVQSPCDGNDALAYRAYLRGHYQLMRPDAQRLQAALAAFREAIDRDPTCARAWAGTAYAYRSQVMTADRDPREMFPLAKAAVERALAIDPNSAEAYSAKGFIEFWYDWDWPRAEASLARAIALNPNHAEAQLAMAHLLVNIGRAQDALPFTRRAIALDTLSPLINSLGSSFLRSAGQKEEAATLLQKTLELEPDAWIAMRIKANQAMARGDAAQAIASLKRAVEISQGHSNTMASLGRVYLRAGDRAAAERVMTELEARKQSGYLPATSLAELAEALGDRNRALDLLEQGYRERDVRISFLLLDWPQLRNEPRYLALLDRLRLPRPTLKSPDREERGP
jgi:TolB-like protein/Tfp pilus assembly protein PilF